MPWAEPWGCEAKQGSNMTDNTGPAEAEKAIGARLKLLRKIKSLTQNDLASLLDVKFQQVQKYENGTNRISASRLNQLAHALNVKWDFFFPKSAPTGADAFYGNGLSDNAQKPMNDMTDDEAYAADVLSFIESNEGLRLNMAFARISDANQRKSIISMAESLAETEKV